MFARRIIPLLFLAACSQDWTAPDAPDAPDAAPGDGSLAQPDDARREDAGVVVEQDASPLADAATDALDPDALVMGDADSTGADDCPGHECQHGGRCVDGVGTYSCNCGGTGYGGERCEIEVDECADSSLQNCNANYRCINTVGEYFCLGRTPQSALPDAVTGAKVKPSHTATTNTVVDNVTGLVWQRATPATYSSCSGNLQGVAKDSCTQAEARGYCDQLTLDGLADWRLPSTVELLSIVDHTKREPAIGASFGMRAANVGLRYWSRSAPPLQPSQATLVAFSTGTTEHVLPGAAQLVRCVRGGEAGPGVGPGRRWARDGKGGVLDRATGLIWASDMLPAKLSFQAAQTACTGGFRLPTALELVSTFDVQGYPTAAFGALPAGGDYYVWSATPDSASSTSAFGVYLPGMTVYLESASTLRNVRCVK